MQKDEIKVGDKVRVIKIGSDVHEAMGLLDILEISECHKYGYGAIDKNGVDWYVRDINNYDNEESCSILVEKVEIGEKVEYTYIVETEESKEYVVKLIGYTHVQKVETEKPFRMPTTAIRMYHKGQWQNCTSEDVELTWDMF